MSNEIQDHAEELDLGHPKVEEICRKLAMLEDTTKHAKEISKRADTEYPVNKSGTVIAASSVYLAGLLCNDKREQATVGDAAGCSGNAIRDCYTEIAEHEGINLNRQNSRRGSVQETPRQTVVGQMKQLLGWG
jgi:transcription initiation factor TFIIIB Brf1 subunit/transcription initiation factor TFIIB